MSIEASVENRQNHHAVVVATDGVVHELGIPPRHKGRGSSVNGGEVLCLAVATCYCNDIYREAKSRGIEVIRVNVDVRAEFGGPGQAARSLAYSATVEARATEQVIRELMEHTDQVAEVQATLRQGMNVHFEIVDALSVD